MWNGGVNDLFTDPRGNMLLRDNFDSGTNLHHLDDLFQDLRRWYTNSVLLSALLRNDLRDFHNLFLNLRHWDTNSWLNSVL